jgi:hypothetical protein
MIREGAKMLATQAWSIQSGRIFPRRTARWSALLTALTLLPLSACATRYDPVLSDRALMPDYSVAEVQGMAHHTVNVEVYGNPFDVTPQAFAGQVAANMNQNDVAPAHFAAQVASNTAKPYRVVWNFAPPSTGVTPNAICEARFVRPDSRGAPIDAYVAYCRGRVALSSVRGRLYYTDSDNSLEFLSLVDAMTTALFPPSASGQRRSGDTTLGKPLSHPF